jgi:serpin B
MQRYLQAVASNKSSLLVGNSVWSRPSASFCEEYKVLVKHYYDAEAMATDSVAVVNNWIAMKTANKIQNVLPIMPNFVLVNTLYFKSDWKKRFDTYRTESKPFYGANGGVKQVAMMHQEGRYKYHAEENYQAVLLPYQDSQFTAMIVLPSTRANNTLEPFQTILGKLNRYETDGSIALPKFRIDCKRDIVQDLGKLGMNAMAQISNDYKPMIGNLGALFINSVIHQVVVEVDEIGTVAAAVTAISASFGCAAPPPRFEMNCNRPFHFFICDTVNGSCLFRGYVHQPTF